MTSKKLLVVGHGQHGKDAFAGMLVERYNVTFQSSSMFVAMRAVWPTLGHEYESFEEMYDDRRNRRVEWKQLIRAYNTPDLAKLGRELFAVHDIYVGLRDYDEFKAIRDAKLFNVSVYVDAEKRVEYRDPSFHIPPQECDIIIDNNGSLEDLRWEAKAFGDAFYQHRDYYE